MAKLSLGKYWRQQPVQSHQAPAKVGPFLTLSRQVGCSGYALGLLLMKILNEEQAAGGT